MSTTTTPPNPEHAAKLARVESYFTVSKLSDAEIAWVQQNGLPVLWHEVLRLRAALARRAGGGL